MDRDRRPAKPPSPVQIRAALHNLPRNLEAGSKTEAVIGAHCAQIVPAVAASAVALRAMADRSRRWRGKHVAIYVNGTCSYGVAGFSGTNIRG